MFTRNWYKLLGHNFGYKPEPVSYINMEGSTKTVNSTGQNSAILLGNATDAYYIPSMHKVRTSYSANGGVIFGTGTTIPTMDDYVLAGEIISTISYSAAIAATVSDDVTTLVGTYTVTNTGTEAITIGEVALMWGIDGSGIANKGLLERTVLDTPVTIPAGGVGQVTYTIRMNYPTA